MQAFPVSVSSGSTGFRVRTALVASADSDFRRRLTQVLIGLRWQVREAGGGAEAWSQAEAIMPEAIIVDSWLPDLDRDEFLKDFCDSFPHVDVLSADGALPYEGMRGPHRHELLYALRSSQEADAAAWNTAPEAPEPTASRPAGGRNPAALSSNPLPELVGDAPCMLEISRRVRLVAARKTPVLIEGPTGSGKEIVAAAVHRLSPRNGKPFVAINCAAIPEALLEAELFGHTRGAFTGAVQGRVGRIEAAEGGTLFLDEIGEMPLALQAKLLRFVECGELQRVGDNETVKVDVRIVAATHRPLAKHAEEGRFRSDLYYRLAVFLIRTPALIDHASDLPLLAEHFLDQMGRRAPIKRLDAGAMARLAGHPWPGNVRELEHVLERAAILAGDEPVITADEIEFGLEVN
ncbi:MAG TPA: sigma-54 dependent transcriptional regulator [Terracidiphilus sp.]|nr:sigma-54 dependent transcriptional regulator [Terracidiphilus sp.]